MADFLVSYDLHEAHPDTHAVFIEECRSVGWGDWAIGPDGTAYKLPNTTLIGRFATLEQARTEFFLAASKAQGRGYYVYVTKWIVVEYIRSEVNSNQKA